MNGYYGKYWYYINIKPKAVPKIKKSSDLLELQ